MLLVTQGATLWQFAGIRRENAQLETQLAEHKTALSSTQSSLTPLQQELERTTATQGELQQRLAQLSTPQLDVAVVDLEPQFGGVVRGGSEPRIVTIAPERAHDYPHPQFLAARVARDDRGGDCG